jgi:dTDP-4-dehydrorhamnose reductase
MTRLDDCEANPKACHRTNLEATRELCAAALEIGTSLLFVSTDQVFDGRAETYSEDSTPSPIHNYGRSKAEAEQIVLEAGGVVARLPLLLGGEATPQRKGADTALRQSMQAGQTIKLFEDEFRAPLPASSAAQGLLLLLEAMKSPNPPRGVFHFSGNEPVSRLQLGQMVQTAHHLSATLLPTQAASWNGPPRPLRLVLTHERATEELSWKAPNLRQYLSADSTP